MNMPLVPSRVYVRIWAALLGLLLLTWGMAKIKLGPLNVVAALLIAFTKMALVVLFFMNVRFSSRLTWLFVAAGIIWFAIMVDLTMSDYLSRRHGQEPSPPPQAMTEPGA
jgi:cytochrome c oxidase subunit IV